MTYQQKPDVMIETSILGESGIYGMLVVTKLMGLNFSFPTPAIAIEKIGQNKFFCVQGDTGQVTGARYADDIDFVETTPDAFIERVYNIYAPKASAEAGEA